MNDFGLLIAQYNSTLPTLTDGQFTEAQTDVNGRLLVSATDLDIRDLSHTQDSIAIGDGTDLLAINADGSLNITDNGGSLTVDAVDLDIRDIDASQDNIAVSDGTNTMAVNADGSINVTGANVEVDLSHIDDSVRLGDGTSFFTSTSENGDIALDVHISNTEIAVTQGSDSPWSIDDNGGSITVDAVDLDIRDIDASQDNIAISDGTDVLAVNADGSINSVVTATDLDIRQLVHTGGSPDSVQIGDGTEILLINADGSINISDNGGSITVDAVDLDIRDLSASQDNVAISDGTDTLEINADGSINVSVAANGSEQYSVTDALAGGGDGLETITAAATPWVTVASYSHTSGTAYIYGYQFAADQNVEARLVTNDTVNDVVYKTSLNSSAMPALSEHFSEGGRIEIAGAASLEIRLQLKKRSTPGGDCLGTGSIHLRSI